MKGRLRGPARRHLVLLAFVVVAALPVGLLTYSAVVLSSDAVSREAQQGATAIADSNGNQIGQQYVNLTQWLDAYAELRIANLDVRGQWDEPTLQLELTRLVQSRQGINVAAIFDTSDNALLSYPLDVNLAPDRFAQDWFPSVSTKWVTDIVTVKSTDGENPGGVAIVLPVHQDGVPSAPPVGFLVAITYLTQTQQFVQAYAHTRGVDLTIVDASGAVLVDPRLPQATRPLTLSRQLKALVNRSGLVVRSGRGGQVFTASYPIPTLGWTVLADVPATGAEADINQLRTTVITVGLVFAVVLALGLIAGALVSQRAQQAGELRTRVDSLRWLHEAAQSMHSRQEQALASEMIAATARAMAEADLAQLTLFQPGSTADVAGVVSSRAEGLPLEEPEILETVLRAAELGSGTIRLANLGGLGEAESSTMLGRLGPVLAMRLEAGDEIVGWLTVARAASRKPFDDEDEALLRQLAQHGATAILRIRYEEDLNVKNDELAQANRLKSEFLAKMSHELRTPLSAIIGFSDLILDGADGAISADLAEDVSQINRSGKSLLDLINDILDLSKIEAGKMVFELLPVVLPELMSEVTSATRPLAEGRGLRIVTDLQGSAEELTAMCDSIRTRQVLMNLVSNALKFTPEGTVTLRGRAVEEGVEVSVIDTGIGIDPEVQSRIFEEFVQADGSTTRRYGGTGLGLSISRRLIELQGGRMGLESTPGVGSRFWFVLPGDANGVHPGTPSDESSLAIRSVNGVGGGAVLPVADQTRPVILVVDDDPQTRELICRRLHESGFETLEASNGIEAIEIAEREHPLAITLDIMMPGMDGWRVLDSLKSHPVTDDIPVVVLSIVDGREHAVELGAEAYLSKPFGKKELRAVLAQVLPNYRTASVLCVDDEPAVRDLLSKSLRSEGMRVTAVPSGAEALAHIARVVPDAILVDLMMPEMSGFELVSVLRSRPILDTMPIIVVSAKELDDDDRRALANRVDRFIPKGRVRPSDLGVTVRQAIQNRRRRAERSQERIQEPVAG